MSYNDYEKSIHDGAPVECYKFIGSFRTYRYTSADLEVTVNGEVYEPRAIRRRGVRAGTQQDENLALELEMPFDVPVVTDYAYSQSPPSLRLEVYRVHRGSSFATDWALLWNGRVASFSVTARLAKIVVPSVFSTALQGELPNAYYQAPCNHTLYDGRCKADPVANTQTTTVAQVGTLSIDVTDDGFSDSFLKAGEILNDRTGERRMILNNVANTITINYAFVDILVGDSVTLRAGCDHSFTTCKAKFNNAINYGGFPLVPNDNPFDGELGGTSPTSLDNSLGGL